jgi:hypothetical protein
MITLGGASGSIRRLRRPGNPGVSVLSCDTPFLIRQVGFPYRHDNSQVVSPRTALDPQPPQAHRFEGAAGQPHRGEQVPLLASHNGAVAKSCSPGAWRSP